MSRDWQGVLVIGEKLIPDLNRHSRVATLLDSATNSPVAGLVPLIGVPSRYCFAGNAALLGCCDVIIATEDSSIGMGGPAMIEGGGLGSHAPADIGPYAVQVANGVIDIGVPCEAAAVDAARRSLACFDGSLATGGWPW